MPSLRKDHSAIDEANSFYLGIHEYCAGTRGSGDAH
jgi:hypothetical protein